MVDIVHEIQGMHLCALFNLCSDSPGLLTLNLDTPMRPQ